MKKQKKSDDITPCPKCNCMTKSIRLGRANYKCGKCGADKSLSDVFYYEATYKEEDVNRIVELKKKLGELK